MKYACKHCKCDIEISQREYAKTGLKKLHDHEIDCFKRRNPNFGSIVSAIVHPSAEKKSNAVKLDTFNDIISYLHKSLGHIPSETQCLRFHMFIQSYKPGSPSSEDCEGFVMMIGRGD